MTNKSYTCGVMVRVRLAIADTHPEACTPRLPGGPGVLVAPAALLRLRRRGVRITPAPGNLTGTDVNTDVYMLTRTM